MLPLTNSKPYTLILRNLNDTFTISRLNKIVSGGHLVTRQHISYAQIKHEQSRQLWLGEITPDAMETECPIKTRVLSMFPQLPK